MSEEDHQHLKQEYKNTLVQFRITGAVALAVLLIGAMFYHVVEKLSWIDSLYFCTITLTTIGYGDIVPHTDGGKIFTMLYAVIGIGIIGTFANLLLKRSVTRRQLIRYSKHKNIKLNTKN